jgi:hypothetical protein
MESKNISGYIRRWHVNNKYIGAGAGARVQFWQMGLYIHQLTDEYMGTDEYKSFLLLSILAASLDGEPPK